MTDDYTVLQLIEYDTNIYKYKGKYIRLIWDVIVAIFSIFKYEFIIF